VITALVLLGTALADALKLALADPPGTVTEAGTVSARLLLESPTGTPLAGAAADKVTVQLVEPGVCTVVGAQVTVERAADGGAVSAMEVADEVPFRLAVIVADPFDGMVPAVAVKLAAAEPAGTRTDSGTVNEELLLEMATVAPLAGAAWANITAQVVDAPEVRLASEQLNPDRAGRGASSESVACAELPLRLAAITVLVLLATELAEAVKVALVAPPAMVTEAGTVRARLPLDKVAATPPAGAAANRDTVQLVEPGVCSELGLHVSALKLGGTDM
jgi:hypothetical protein